LQATAEAPLHFAVKFQVSSEQELNEQFQQIRAQCAPFWATNGSSDTSSQPASTPADTGTSSTPRRRTRGQSRPMRARQRASTPSGGRRPSTRVTDEQIINAITEHPGWNAMKLSSELGISHETALRRLNKLEEGGAIYREGSRNQTKWYARASAPVEPVAA
jgi:hypothetical protein